MVDAIEDWQDVFLRTLGRRMVFAADEYYLMADRPFPAADAYEGFSMHEDGIGMARTFELEFHGARRRRRPVRRAGFFAAVDAAAATRPAYTGPAAHAACAHGDAHGARSRAAARRTDRHPHRRVRRAGHRTAGRRARPRRRARHPGRQRVLRRQHRGHRADGRRTTCPRARRPSRPATATCCPTSACREGRFLDGTTVDDLPRPVEVVATDGISLRRARWSHAS